MTLPWDHKVGAKQNHLASYIFLWHLSSDQDESWCGDEIIQGEHSDTTFE